MNKFKTIFVIVFFVFIAINIYDGLQKNKLSDVVLANIEALANDEYALKQWYRHDYELDNGTPAVNCWKGGSDNCLLPKTS